MGFVNVRANGNLSRADCPDSWRVSYERLQNCTHSLREVCPSVCFARNPSNSETDVHEICRNTQILVEIGQKWTRTSACVLSAPRAFIGEKNVSNESCR
jgi:hypothetical protein